MSSFTRVFIQLKIDGLFEKNRWKFYIVIFEIK